MRIGFSSVAGVLLIVWLAACQRGGEADHRLHGKAMGTSWTLRYAGAEVAGLAADIAAKLEAIEEIFSTWREGSVVSRLNRGDDVPLPPEFAQVMRLATQVKLASGGAFDVEIGDVVDAFGFGPGSGGRLDFSGIAKGFALDEIGHLLAAAGVDEFLLEIGGELLGRGGREWRVGLESPDPGSVGNVRRVISLREAAVATSGSYRRFRGELNHLIDPRTRRPVAHDCVSVSVLAATCAEADAWATALMVLGAEDGLALAGDLGLRAIFVRRRGDGSFEEAQSAACDGLSPSS